MTTKQKSVPAAALQFSIGHFELGTNGSSAKSAPFKMVARSGQPIEHWFWGNVVHDLGGMKLAKSRVAIDYAHDPKEVIGYANHFESDSGDLVVSGALVPFKESDRATEVIHKQREGVPYEASINFGGDGIKLEEVRDGQSVSVNGYEFAGPGVVIREWPLRGIAICPYGADQNTSTEFSADHQVLVEIQEADMATNLTAAHLEEENQVLAEAQAVDATQAPDPDMPAEVPAVPDAVDAAEPAPPASTELSASEGSRFLEAFGDRGGVWFAQGKSFAEAQALYIDSLRGEVEQLKQRLSASRVEGEVEPVEFSQHVPPTPKGRLIRIAGKK
jgi:hypothetical protein